MTTRFISCDWGTSRLRLRLVERFSGRILAARSTEEGIRQIAHLNPDPGVRRERLATTLEQGIAALAPDLPHDLPVVMSGMASANLGWQELPYASLPADIDGSTLHWIDLPHAGRRVRLISGLRSGTDVMRGEETELVGLFAPRSRSSSAKAATCCAPIWPRTTRS